MWRWLVILLALPAALAAQDRRASHCIALVRDDLRDWQVIPARWGAPLDADTVRISYIDHAMFLIEGPGGETAVTDYSGYIGPTGFTPDVATMNNAHSTHWTWSPDPAIPHVLEGWGTEAAPRAHRVVVGGMLVRNVHTDTRRGDGDPLVRVNGNSIFIFEVAGLCIGHLGHLHHEPDANQYAAIGRLDVVMIAVDGGLTVDTATAVRITERLRASIVLTMHWWGRGSLDRFTGGLSDRFEVIEPGRSFIEVSLSNLPSRPTVVVLEPRLLSDDG